MKHQTGKAEVISGSMFSGKTEELIRRVRRAIIAKQKVQVFKPDIDTRFSIKSINSHTGQKLKAIPVASAQDIPKALDEDTTVVAIDEAQFFDDEIINVIEELADRGIRVIVAGLNLDFRAEPFGSMPEILSRADHVDTLHAICMVCGEEASRTQRLVDGEPADYDDPIILIGAEEVYEARCREHHIVPRRDIQITHVLEIAQQGHEILSKITKLNPEHNGTDFAATVRLSNSSASVYANQRTYLLPARDRQDAVQKATNKLEELFPDQSKITAGVIYRDA